MKIYFCSLFGLCAGSMFFVATAIGANCQALNGKTLLINANGFKGSMTITTANSFSTTVKFNGEPADNVVGTCQGRRLVFTRTRPGSFKQVYDGWIFEKSSGVAGTFSHNGPKNLGWYGIFR